MSKRKSIFGKIFKVNITTLIFGLIISVALQYTFVLQYTKQERENTLRESLRTIYGRVFMPMVTNNQTHKDFISSFLENYTHSTGNYILIITPDGDVTISSYEDENGIAPQFLKEEYYKDVLQGKEITATGTMGIYKTPMLNILSPVSINGKIAGVIMISSPMPTILRQNKMIARIFILPISFVVMIALVLSYVLSRRIARPIKEMSKAAKLFSKGDFKERVCIYDEDEIGELAETFNNMADGLEKLENTRRSFVANVSHELRTPMTTITGFIDGILDGTIPPDKGREYLTIVLNETRRLSRLVSDLLDVSKIDEDEFKLEISNFDLNEMIRLCIIGFEKRINEKQISINVDFESDECFINADVDGVQRVLTNLIDNAVKYTYIEGRIDLAVYEKGNQIAVSIRNTGEGIPEADAKNIFERFYKVDKSRGLNKEGTGLGLYIVKNIINRLGGNITVQSIEGEYTEFVFTLNK